MSLSVQQVTEKVNKEYPIIAQVLDEIGKKVVGQRTMVERLLIGILGDGHILVEGVPGLAKTTAVKALAEAVDANFSRIQFTPDLLPADLVGTQIYSPRDGSFSVKRGPLFANIILADEINRAPAKVQSALLEAMQEKQVTIGDQTFILPAPFLVMATQNPIEQEGTYPLPEAQVDRFMLKVKISYPSKEEEIQITRKMSSEAGKVEIKKVLTPERIMELRNVIDQIFVDEKLYGYVTDLVFATRNPEHYGLKELRTLIEYGASPRASINLVKASKVYAFLHGRGYVTPQDIKSIAYDVFRHRVIVSYEAEAQDLNSDDLLKKIFDRVDVP
ncbi:MAG: MoxR family ATPase [Oligoflexia bacterium]|nr:MoxR family ATPase [Oligoflexia bacterium]